MAFTHPVEAELGAGEVVVLVTIPRPEGVAPTVGNGTECPVVAPVQSMEVGPETQIGPKEDPYPGWPPGQKYGVIPGQVATIITGAVPMVLLPEDGTRITQIRDKFAIRDFFLDTHDMRCLTNGKKPL